MGLHYQETQHVFSVNGRFSTETVATVGCVVINGAGIGGIGIDAIGAGTNMAGRQETL